MEKTQVFNAVAIARVSTVKQDVFGESLDDQVNQVNITRERIASQYNCEIKIVKTFELAESASVKLDLQPMQKVLEYIRAHNHKEKIPIRFAFIKSLDRFTRAGATVYGQLQAEFAKEGVTLVDTYGIVNPAKVNTLEHLGVEYEWSTFRPTYISELLETERAKSEVRDIETRMLGAAIRYVRLGYWRGSVPLGFITVKKDTEHGKRYILNPHPVESKWFIKMFELKAEGVKTDQEITEEINKMGFVTRPMKFRDKENSNKIIAVKGKRTLTPKMLRKYIQNPIYAGVNTEKWLFYDGKLHPVYLRERGVVSVELFNKANHGKVIIVDEGGEPAVYKGSVPDWMHKKLKLNPDFPWKQYVCCPICGHQLKGSFSRGKSGHRFPYYHCSLGHKYWAVSGKTMDQTINEFIANVRFSKKFIYNFERKFVAAWEAKLSQLNQNTIDWEKMIIELRDKQKVLEEKLKFASTQTGFQIIEEEIEKTKSQIAQATIERNKKEDEEVDIQTIVNAAKYWMEHFHFLLQETPNSLHRAALFGKIFEEKPTFENLQDGTPKLSSLFALNEAFNMGQDQLSRATVTNTFLRREVDLCLVCAIGPSVKNSLERLLKERGDLTDFPLGIIRDMKEVVLFTDSEIPGNNKRG